MVRPEKSHVINKATEAQRRCDLSKIIQWACCCGYQTRSSVSQASAFHQATCSLCERVKPLKKKKNLSSKKSRDSPILFTWLEFPWYNYLCSVSGWWSQAGAQSTSFPVTTQPKGHIGQQTAAQNGRQQSQLASRSRRRKLLVVVTMY